MKQTHVNVNWRGVFPNLGGGGGAPLVEGEFFDSYTEAAGIVSQGAAHTAQIDLNPSGLDWVADLMGASSGLANIDAATNRLIPVANDGNDYGGANQFLLNPADEFEHVMVAEMGAVGVNTSIQGSIRSGGIPVVTQLNQATDILASGLFASAIGVGLVVDAIPFAAGARTIITAVKNGIYAIKLDGRTPLYANVTGILDSLTWRHIANAIRSTVAGTYMDSQRVRPVTLSFAGLGGTGDFQDLFATNGDIRNGTPAADPFGVGWQLATGFFGVLTPANIVSNKIEWAAGVFNTCDVPLGGFVKEAQIEIPLDFGAVDNSRAIILLSAIGAFGTGISLEYKTINSGADVEFKLKETSVFADDVLKTVVLSNPGSGLLKFAYKKSAGKMAFQLDSETIEDVVTARDITIRHALFQGVAGAATVHTWDSIDIKQTATIL